MERKTPSTERYTSLSRTASRYQKRKPQPSARRRSADARRASARDTETRRSSARDTETRRSSARDVETRRSSARDTEMRRSSARDTEMRRSSARDTEMRRSSARDTEVRGTVSRNRNTTRQVSRKRRRRRRSRLPQVIAAVILLLLLFFVVKTVIGKFRSSAPEIPEVIYETETETEAMVAEALPEPEINFQPHAVESTRPENLIQYTEIIVNDVPLANSSDYHPSAPITFATGSHYTDLPGVITFRGNNFRNQPSYGFADMKENRLRTAWNKETGALSCGEAVWTGSGWTGQPLIVKWPESTKQHMNLYDWAKAKQDLVEVIYACMDGYIYFMDLTTGEATRESVFLGYTFKGSGALDPRGYPIMYLGAGYDNNQGRSKAFIINLLDCSVMTTFGQVDPYSLRGELSFFDSSALVDAETDTLIYPGENGILYLMHLNTNYNESAGTLSINPDPIVKWRYNGVRTGSQFWLGMEDSAAVYKGYLFVADNGGNLMCLDLNTLQLVWVQDTLDDSNSTPVLSIENGHLYLYVSTSFHLGWRSYNTAPIPIWKIDAETGEIVWQTEYECYTQDGVSGGVQSTIATGNYTLSDYIYVTVAMTGNNMYDGVLSCIDKRTGEVAWQHSAYYAWSSPVCVYNSDGTGYVLYCSCGGVMYLLDGLTGQVLHTIELSNGAIESSPAVYENYAVVGTRACKIWGVELS